MIEKLKDCQIVIIKTYKSDKYDRYLVDIFYKDGEEDASALSLHGTYLNAQMLAENLVQPYR